MSSMLSLHNIQSRLLGRKRSLNYPGLLHRLVGLGQPEYLLISFCLVGHEVTSRTFETAYNQGTVALDAFSVAMGRQAVSADVLLEGQCRQDHTTSWGYCLTRDR